MNHCLLSLVFGFRKRPFLIAWWKTQCNFRIFELTYWSESWNFGSSLVERISKRTFLLALVPKPKTAHQKNKGTTYFIKPLLSCHVVIGRERFAKATKWNYNKTLARRILPTQPTGQQYSSLLLSHHFIVASYVGNVEVGIFQSKRKSKKLSSYSVIHWIDIRFVFLWPRVGTASAYYQVNNCEPFVSFHRGEAFGCTWPRKLL